MFALSLALAAAVCAQVPEEVDLEDRYGARWTPEAAVYQSAALSVVRVRLEARIENISARFGAIEIGGTGERWLSVSNGTGVIYSDRGLVITNAHVVDARKGIALEDQRLRVVLSAEAADDPEEREFSARLLAVDPGIDLALLQIQSERTFSRIPFGRDDDLLIGEKVVTLGAPFGRSLMLSSGILSALDQEVLIADSDGVTKRMNGLIQTDAAVNEGFSGGPMMNAYGELIGITVSRVEAAEGIAYAIPIAQINASLRDRLLGNSWTGMKVVAAGPSGWPQVERVHPRGPAARAGIVVGDRILLANERPIGRLEQWADVLTGHQAGDSIELLVRRSGEGERAHGMTLELLDAELRDSLGLFGAEFVRGSYS
ncbi:MAG: S1C family serine protease, partial [Planctomycetes bacterium]|nr:S1C family serine protease [Planctomycetota bacterium]